MVVVATTGTRRVAARCLPASAWRSGRCGWPDGLGLPVVTLIDTPGAEPGASSEMDGIAREIARTFAAMAEAPVADAWRCAWARAAAVVRCRWAPPTGC